MMVLILPGLVKVNENESNHKVIANLGEVFFNMLDTLLIIIAIVNLIVMRSILVSDVRLPVVMGIKINASFETI